MIAKVDYASVEPGTEIPEREFVVQRRTLLMYCGACSDFAPIHWNERIAKSVGLPDVIAHGTLTMAKAIRAVTDWAGDPGAVVDYRVRFSRPFAVPDDDAGSVLRVSGVVERKLDGNRVVVGLSARSGEDRVLSGACAVVQLG